MDPHTKHWCVIMKRPITIAEVHSTSPPNLSWRRDLLGPKLVAWNNLLPRIANIELGQEPDVFCWNLTPNGQFSVKSHYQALIHIDVPNLNNCLWNLKAPLKIKIFLWYLRRGVVLTKDNLAKRNWQGSKTCCFCHKEETIKHLFFDCRFARAVWSITHVASGLPKPHSVSHMFGNWLGGTSKNLKPLVLLGAATTCWSLGYVGMTWFLERNILFSFVGNLLGYSLAPYVVYSREVGYTGFGCGSFAALGLGGQGYLLLGIWMAF